MNWLRNVRGQPWRLTVLAVVGLLVAILIAGVVGLFLNQNVKEATDEALRYDVELEDHGDDLRVAVLDLRDQHRNITFTGPSRGGIEQFEETYNQLEQEIDELEELGVRDPGAPQPDEIRTTAEAYYENFRPAIDLYDEDQAAFTEASDEGLERIGELEAAAKEIDKLGEELTADELGKVDRASATATFVLLAVVSGLMVAGAVLAYVAVRVVSELRKLYIAQQATSRELAEASEAKSNLIADVSHELRTPLTVLKGNAEVGLTLDPGWEHREILDEIVGESSRMTQIVEDLLFLSRSDSMETPFETHPVSVGSLLDGISRRAENLTSEREATLQTTLSGEGELKVDQRRIEQAVIILMDNAFKYSPSGGKTRLASAVNNGELHLTVADEGPGIPEEELPRIFERFYRMDKARSRKMGGSGLGLPIAKATVEAHGGRIQAESRLGEGTKMTIHLPLIAVPEQAADQPGPDEAAPQSPQSSQPEAKPRSRLRGLWDS